MIAKICAAVAVAIVVAVLAIWGISHNKPSAEDNAWQKFVDPNNDVTNSKTYRGGE